MIVGDDTRNLEDIYSPRIIRALRLVAAEFDRARTIHDPMSSAHEGYAILLEEVDELWDLVKEREPRYYAMHKEAMQVAAMGLRFMLDVCQPRMDGAEIHGENSGS